MSLGELGADGVMHGCWGRGISSRVEEDGLMVFNDLQMLMSWSIH